MADKTLKSLNFGGADNYFPLPIVSMNDNDNILVVADGEWVAKSPNDITGQYVWSKKDSADGPVTGYVISNDGEKYPDGGWSEGIFYTLELEPKLPYLSFIGNEDFTLKTGNTTKNWNGTLEYSTDTSTWNTWNGTAISSSGSKLYLRGTGNTKITGNTSNYRFVFTGTDALKIACKGNIENLLDYETVSAGGHPTMAFICYGFMFYGCTALTTAPELPATTLAGYCYNAMFYGCTALTTVPELPATTLATCCYESMFSRCTNIKLSTTQTGEYQTAYRIPKSGTGTTSTDALNYMFNNTGGTFTGTPSINTTYYTSNTVV